MTGLIALEVGVQHFYSHESLAAVWIAAELGRPATADEVARVAAWSRSLIDEVAS